MPQALEKDPVRSVLDDVALAIVARRQPVSGKEVIDALNEHGLYFSPGTVYPTLHDMRDEGVLDVREVTKEKLYTVADSEDADERLLDATRELLGVAEFVARETPTAEKELTEAELVRNALE